MPPRKPLPVIVVDTREQQPWEFASEVFETRRAALATGDYSLEGREAEIAVERKSLDDFVGCCVRARERFFEEMKRMSEMDHACVVVEATYADVVAHRYNAPGVLPATVLGTALGIWLGFGVPVYFIGPRPEARAFAERMLLMLHERQEKRARGKKKALVEAREKHATCPRAPGLQNPAVGRFCGWCGVDISSLELAPAKPTGKPGKPGKATKTDPFGLGKVGG